MIQEMVKINLWYKICIIYIKKIYIERNYHIFSFYKFIFNLNLKYIMQKFLMQKKMGRIESLLGMGPWVQSSSKDSGPAHKSGPKIHGMNPNSQTPIQIMLGIGPIMRASKPNCFSRFDLGPMSINSLHKVGRHSQASKSLQLMTCSFIYHFSNDIFLNAF